MTSDSQSDPNDEKSESTLSAASYGVESISQQQRTELSSSTLEQPDADLPDNSPTEPASDFDRGLQSIGAAREDYTAFMDRIGNALTDAASTVGSATAAITSFLAPVPAMLLIFPSARVPIPVPVPVMYKPERLKFSKSANWEGPSAFGDLDDSCSDKKTLPHHDVPPVHYKGGGPEKLSLTLFFDTTDTQLDVRLHTKPIQLLVYRVPFMSQPPLVMFSWGMMLSKMSYVSEVEIEYQMFRADGTPVRAEVQLTLTEYDMGWLSLAPMNPTSVSEARKTWVVTEGQTLDWIAFQEYGDPAQWRHIARTNNLDDPRDLRPGQILKLTPLF